MTHALTLTFSLKQDAESQARLEHLAEVFADDVQPVISEALKNSELVHFARVVVVHNKYLQVITEFEGDQIDYIRVFRRDLDSIFKNIFMLVEDAPDVDNEAAFIQFCLKHQIRSLGTSTSPDGDGSGWLFSAYGDKTVKDILAKLDSA